MVEAIIPDLTPIKVIIVFLICNAKSAKPDQYINTIKLDRCGPSIHRQKKTKKHARLSKLRQSAQRRLVVLPLFAIWHLADHRGGGGGDGTSKLLSFQPTTHGLPPMMLKPREPPSRRRTTVTLLVSPSYKQTGETHVSKEMAGSYSTYTTIQY